MDIFDAQKITFLDVSGIAEHELQSVATSLFEETNENVELPWTVSQRRFNRRNVGKIEVLPQNNIDETTQHHTLSQLAPSWSKQNSMKVPYFPPILNNHHTAPSSPSSDNSDTYNHLNSPLSPISVEKCAEDGTAEYKDEKGRRLPLQANGDFIKENGEVKQQEPVQNASPSSTKSWASLFASAKSSTNNGCIENVTSSSLEAVNNKEIKYDERSCPIKNPSKAQFIDPNHYRMGEFLMKYSIDGKSTSVQPRGLINRSNYCYINSILQALLACPQVYNLLSALSKNGKSSENKTSMPVIDGMCRFVKEFQHLPAGMRANRRNDKNQKRDQGTSIDYDLAFEPFWIYRILNGMRSDSFLVEGRQEDAEEFLGCLLNGLNDEMLELMKLVQGDLVNNQPSSALINEEQVDGNWHVMGPKNRGNITRQTDLAKTPISCIFGGFVKSRIHRADDQSTYNIQPFFTLQLNIEKVNTVHEALEALVVKNQLEGVTSEKTNEEVEAWQQVTLEELPVVLVLHLKCFDYKLNGCTKIVKSLEFPIDLKIDSKLLSSKPTTQKEKQYKLFAVVYHDGKEATKGHYITDAFHVGYNTWIRYDDSSVRSIQEECVLNPQGNRIPYLLFYRRSDSIRNK